MSFSTELEQATIAAVAVAMQAQEMQNQLLLQQCMRSFPCSMAYFSSDCDDGEEQEPDSGWLSSLWQSTNTTWAKGLAQLAALAWKNVGDLVGRLAPQAANRQRSPVALRDDIGQSWPAPSGPGWSGFHSPLKNGFVSSPFGPRWGRMHRGVDIAAPTGTPIQAAAAGVVETAGWVQGYGNCVLIDHGNGRKNRYAHCSKVGVQPGQPVKRGQVIAEVGSTGNSTGPHLHFEVISNGKRENPCNHVHL
jgi:murein DD-endopeptidase MepM/ murein hydrolase activator NlpD